MIVLVAALRRELDPFRKLLRVEAEEPVAGAICTEGHVDGAAVALVQSGIGRERSQAATAMAVERYRPDLIVSTGYAGGLVPEVKAADLVLARRIYAIAEAGANGAASAPPLDTDPGLLDRVSITLEEGLLDATVGDLVSVPAAMPGPSAKQELARATGALVVDMESYWVGRTAEQAGCPFLAARVASDEVGDLLPDYARFMDEMGTIRPLSAAWYFLSHPHHLLGAPMLAANAQRGARTLGCFGALLFTMAHRATTLRP